MGRSRSLALLCLAVTGVLAASSFALALQPPQQPTRFDALVVEDPSIRAAASPLLATSADVPLQARSGWGAFSSAHGGDWQITLDARSGAPLLVQGEGIPWIPGPGNALAGIAPPALDDIAASLRDFVKANRALLLADERELVLNREASGQITPELWQVVFDRAVEGVPVAGDGYVFSIGHGNLISFGAPRWSEVATSPAASIGSIEAMGRLFTRMGLQAFDRIDVIDRGTLQFTPMAAEASPAPDWKGPVGQGYRAALAWRFVLAVEGEAATWVGLVDAHSGAILALYDDTKYAQVKGGVFPISNDASCPTGCEQPNFPMPFANITIGGSPQTSGSMGGFTCTPGGSTATTTLNAQYIRVVDTCGAISVATTCDSDLDLKSSAGTDCTVPAGTSAGNTHATRTGFYHLNRIKEHARVWMPANAWLTAQLTDNVNINLTCNAFWSPGSGTVNFYRSGGGCRNTGEIAAIFLHEWGHGMSQNDGAGSSNPDEAYADISSFLLTHASCIGRGFLVGANCSGYGNACLNCSGVRDVDWNQRANHTPQTPENWPASCPGGSGPCGREVHCEGYLAAETLWDLAVRDLPASGIDQQTAWQIADRLWFRSRIGTSGNGYSCGAPATNRSCAATAWMQQLRVADDNDGNLANGTPHAAAIFAAFARHNITCGAAGDAANQNSAGCPALAAPTLTPTASPNQIALSWTSVAGASSYNVLRSDQGCSWGYNVIANVPGTSYTDVNLPNGFPLSYAIQAVGASSACTGTVGTCTTVQAGGPHAIYQSNARVADTCAGGGAGNNNGVYDAGEQIQFSVTLRNDGVATLTGVTATVTSLTAGVTMVDAAASYANLAVGASGTSLAPHFTAQLDAGLACGTTIDYQVTITANEGSWMGSFTQTVGTPIVGGGTILSESFAGGIPGTWSIVDGGTGTGTARTWTTANPGGRAFTAPLVAPVAIMDSDWDGTSASQDEQLITPVMNLSTATTVTLDYDEFFRWYNLNQNELGDVDVRSSLTGGTWVNVVRNQGTSNPPGATTTGAAHRTVSITAQAAGAADVQLRFHYYTAQYEWWWQVDNVVVTYTAPGGCTMNACAGAASADLSVVKTDSPDPVAAGANITYTVTVANAGPSAASTVQLSDATPAGTTFQSIAPAAGWFCSTPLVGATGPITCNTASLASGANAVFSIVVKVNFCAGNGAVISNTASVTTTTSDPSGANNSATATTTVTDSGACNDGNACTQTDACQAGVCIGTNPVTCTASDQCHDAGTCNPATGVCSNPAKPNGSACSDADACTQTDTCQAGTCTGASPVVCAASDQCHDAGTCNPATGICSNPAKPNGSACSDADACTQTDTCQAGACTGANPVVCAASDQCHDAGTCNPATGICSNPAKLDGSACSDADACTQTDTCQAGACTGANPVVCAASDQCHDAGTCNPATGICSNPARPDGSACSDADACTQTDTCQAGACTGASPVVCAASDQCHDAGTCNPATGVCSNPARPDGSACSDADACTQTDMCQSGTCTGANPVVCAASDQCHDAGTCNPATGICSNPARPDGSGCSDADACTQTDTCQAGACTGANPVVCAASDQCHDAGTCNPATGICSNPARPDGSACDDGAACTVQDACSSGTCAGSPAPPPAEVGNSVAVTKSGTIATIAWTDPPGPYNVYRGSRMDQLVCSGGPQSGSACLHSSDCPMGACANTTPWAYNQSCLASLVPGPASDTDLPAAGGTFFYLVAREDACGESVPGHASNGTPIANAMNCPAFAVVRAAPSGKAEESAASVK